MVEHLIDVDQSTLELKSSLATSWQMSPDAKTWMFDLRKAVQFHFGYGEFTAKDVIFSLQRIVDVPGGSKATFAGVWQNLVGKTPDEVAQRVKAVDDYTVQFNLKSPWLTLASYQLSTYTDLMIYSKAQWDQGNAAGTNPADTGARQPLATAIAALRSTPAPEIMAKPAGTAPYRFTKRGESGSFRYERVENHWRITPAFKELVIIPTRSGVDNLAILLAGEAHIADLPPSLHSEVIKRGMRVIPSRVPFFSVQYVLGGQYYLDRAALDPSLPWTNPKTGIMVREGLNRAIDRKELLYTLFGGQGDLMMVNSFHPTLSGWNPLWAGQFEAKYGYDPEKAKQLIAEAGYPDGFAAKVVSLAQTGFPEQFPEMPELADALVIYLRRIGLKVDQLKMDRLRFHDLYQNQKAQGMIWPWQVNYRSPEDSIGSTNYSKLPGSMRAFEAARIDQNLEAIRSSADPAERNRLLQEIGQTKFDQYEMIPLFWLPIYAGVNGSIVADYKFGTNEAVFTHLEYVQPAR